MSSAAVPYAGPDKHIVGVLGGMGPLATADFMVKIITRTRVASESDHLPLAVWSNPEIPDRTLALLGRGPSPVPAMADGVRRLLSLGAEVIAIPCNTAHAFLAELREQTGARFLNMVDVAVDQVLLEVPAARRVGILSTQGTRLAELYARACEARSVVAVELDQRAQEELVDRAIRQVKLGGDLQEASALILEAAVALRDLGADALVAGCTEIPLVAGRAAEVLPVIDATDCLAGAVVERMLGEVRAS